MNIVLYNDALLYQSYTSRVYVNDIVIT